MFAPRRSWRDWLVPAEGEEWLLGVIVVIMVLGALRDRVEPLLIPPPTVSARISLETFGRLDVNEATLAELETLPGIGPRLAARIVTHRETHGSFRSPEDLLEVRGIGPKTFERLRGFVRVDSIGRTGIDVSVGFAQGGEGMAER